MFSLFILYFVGYFFIHILYYLNKKYFYQYFYAGYFIIKVPKLNYAENFEDLHMLTKLLTPYGKTSAAAPNIEAIGLHMYIKFKY